MSIFCKHKWKCNIKKSFVTHDSSDSYHCILQHMQFMCEKCHKFEDKTYYICYGNFGPLSSVFISENWGFIKEQIKQGLTTMFNDKQIMIDTIRADLKYQSFIKKLEKK